MMEYLVLITMLNYMQQVKKYICKYCGKEFDSAQKLGGHIIHCKMNPDYEKNKINCNNFTKYNNDIKLDTTIYYCQYCGKECKGKNSLRQHEIRCKENPNRIKNFSNFIEYNKSVKNGERKGSNQFIKAKELGLPAPEVSEETRNKIGNGWRGKHLPEEMKEKQRIGLYNHILKLHGKFRCSYNPNACKFIDELNKQNNWNLQHAENGGEYQVGGYFVDGYDKELNIVFEYDEPRHYKNVNESILRDKDIQRQEYIIKKLNCEFWRYNEKKKLLYKVN